MTEQLTVKSFKGVVTNVDQEDLADGVLTKLVNMRVNNGRLLKTFAFGDKGLGTLSSTPMQIGTFINDNLPYGYMYFAIFIDKTTKIVTIKYCNSVNTAWTDIDNAKFLKNSIPTVYHKYSQLNPVIVTANTLRILPGDVGKADGVHTSESLWIGYIDRYYFNRFYRPAKGFYAYTGTLTPPDIKSLNMVITEEAADTGEGFTTGQEFKYKLSYIYDGVQETLLSDALYHKCWVDNKYLKFVFKVTKASHPLRITGMKVYRAEKLSGVYETFKYISTIDFLATPGAPELDEKIGGDDLASGRRYIYCSGIQYFDFDSTKYYRLKISKGGLDYHYKIKDYDGATLLGTDYDTFYSESEILHDFYGSTAVLEVSTDGITWNTASQSNFVNYLTAYCGSATFIVRTHFTTPNSFVGDKLYTDKYFSILGNIGRAIHVLESFEITGNGVAWKIVDKVPTANGMQDFGSYVEITFYDKVLPSGAAADLENSPSNSVNGKFAMLDKGRLWQYNPVLAPGTNKEERHDAWFTYSEYEQYDSTPVSNEFQLIDREGGEGTGMVASFNSILFFKRNAIYRLLINNVIDPTSWNLKESIFDKGNIAPRGLVKVGNTVYFCYYDGIYKIDFNINAAADDTPLLRNKITEAIEDQYLALSDSTKEQIIGEYKPIYNEILWWFYEFAGERLDAELLDGSFEELWTSDSTQSDPLYGSDVDNYFSWAYNILTGDWRQENSAHWPYSIAKDEKTNIMFVDDNDNKVYTTDVSESVDVSMRTKEFLISNYRKESLRYTWVTYRSGADLTVNLYIDDDDYVTPVATKTLVATSDKLTKKLTFKVRANRFKIEIIDSVTSTYDTEIFGLKFEYEQNN